MSPTTETSSWRFHPGTRFSARYRPPVKNRVHIDGGGTEREALVERLRMLGATELGSHEAPGLVWTVMQDPEGNEFCVGSPEA
ncbi:VOC family protein [Corynebacterium pyruviciproducens]